MSKKMIKVSLCLSLLLAVLISNFTMRVPKTVSARVDAVYVEAAVARVSTNVWGTQRVVAENTFSITPNSIVVDPVGRVHAIYGGDHLYHAMFDGQNWQIQTVDPAYGVGSQASVAIDGAGNLHVVYRDRENDQIKYVAFDGVVWNYPTTLPVSLPSSTAFLAIAANADGLPHIAVSRFQRVQLAIYNGASWDVEDVEIRAGQEAFDNGNISIGVDSQNNTYLTYAVNIRASGVITSQVRYAENASGAWTITPLTAPVRPMASLQLSSAVVVDSADTVHIAFDGDWSSKVTYARYSNGELTMSLIDNQGTTPAIAVAVDGTPHVLYKGGWGSNGGIYYATPSGTGWVKNTIRDGYGLSGANYVDEAGLGHVLLLDNSILKHITTADFSNSTQIDQTFTAGRAADMVFDDASNATHISHVTTAGIEYARLVNGNWARELIEEEDINTIFSGTAIAISATSQEPCVVFRAVVNSESLIKYACRSGSGNWSVEVVDNFPNTYVFRSDFDLEFFNGVPHIVYTEIGSASSGTETKIKYAVKDGAAWTTEIIHAFVPTSMTNPPTGPTLAVDSTGTPHVSFHSWENPGAYYATKAPHWTLTQVMGGAGSWPDIILDNNDRPIIAIAEHLVFLDGLVWTSISPLPGGAQRPRLCLDHMGNPHISYMQDGALNYAWLAADGSNMANWETGTWMQEVVDSTISGSESHKIATDAFGHPFIVYGDSNNGDLKLAWTRHQATLTTGGGSISAFGMAHFEFPAGAFDDTVIVSIVLTQPFTNPLPHALVNYEIEATYVSTGLPATLQEGQHYEVTLRYDQADVPQGVDEQDLALFHWDGESWVRERSSRVDVSTNTVTATPTHFSLWALMFQRNYDLYLPAILSQS